MLIIKAMEPQSLFEEKVQSLTAKEVVETMIKGLENEWVKVNLDFNGGVVYDGVAYGGAGINAVCEIMQKPFIGEEINDRNKIVKARVYETYNKHGVVSSRTYYYWLFELAINELRRGNNRIYNEYAKMIGMSLLPKSKKIKLPWLTTKNYKEKLEYYRQYALSLPNEKLV